MKALWNFGRNKEKAVPPPANVQIAICGKRFAVRSRFRPWLETLEDRITPNSAPVAVTDSYEVHQGEQLSVSAPGVLANDSDADQDPLTVELYSGASDGYLYLNSDGSFYYSPDSEFVGSDSFQYRAFDGTAYSAPVTVSIDVTNQAPVGKDDFYWVDVNGSLSMSAANGVLTNDSDPDEDALSVELYTDVSDGYLYLNSDGSFVYYPNYDFEGTDGFVYTLSDGADSVQVNVNFAVNQIPIYFVNTVNDTQDANFANGQAADGQARDIVGNTSLRAAIEEGNAQGAGEVIINFVQGLTGQTINLGIALPNLNNDFVINGLGAEDLTVQRNPAVGNFRIFTINSGKTIDINNLTLSNGRAIGESPHGQGGAIYNSGTLTLWDLYVSDNVASVDGGAIYNAAGGTLSIENSAIFDNQAQFGGGIGNDGLAYIESTEIYNNVATQYGGAIFNDTNGELGLVGTDVYNNEAASRAGGILNLGDFVMLGGMLQWNWVTANNGEGGGLFNSDSGNATFTNVNIKGNEADGNNGKGGAVYLQDGTVTLNQCTVEDNSCGLQNGGNLGYVEFEGTLNVNGGNIAQDQNTVEEV